MTTAKQQQTDHGHEIAETARGREPADPGPAATLGAAEKQALRRTIANRGMATPAGILALQRTAGNRAVQRFVAQRPGPAGEQQALEVRIGQGRPADTATGRRMPPVQRAEAKTEPKGKDQLTQEITGGSDPKSLFGVVAVQSLKREGDKFTVTLWKHIGLPENWNDVDDGETTEENWKEQLDGLASMGAPDAPKWYSKEAVRAHEEVHENSFKSVLSGMDDELKGKFAEDKEYVQASELRWLRDRLSQQGKQDHNSGATDGPEAAVVTEKIKKVWKYAVAQGWPKKVEKLSLHSQYRTKFLVPQQGLSPWLLKILGKKTISTIKLDPTKGAVE